LFLLFTVEVVASGLLLTVGAVACVISVVTPREWSLGRKLVTINEFFWSPNVAVDLSGEVHIA